MAHLYLLDSAEGLTVGGTAELSGSEAHHAVVVGRARPGEHLLLSDGRGTMAGGEVLTADREHLSLRIDELREVPEPSPRILLVQALAKGDRDELAVQAATELGADAVYAWAAQRSVSRWEGPKVAKGLARWEGIVREASKQSLRARVPGVAGPLDLAGVCALAEEALLVVLDPRGDTPIGMLDAGGRDVALIVGPEGGISDGELEALVSAGAVRCALGSTVLRTSTAGPAAISILNLMLGRW